MAFPTRGKEGFHAKSVAMVWISRESEEPQCCGSLELLEAMNVDLFPYRRKFFYILEFTVPIPSF